MTAVSKDRPGIIYDKGLVNYDSITNAFPARNLQRTTEDGAWFIAYRSQLLEKFIPQREISTDTVGSQEIINETASTTSSDFGDRILDGFYLLRFCCVEDPRDVASLNISGQVLKGIQSEDLKLFDNIVHVNAAENYLELDGFRSLPALRELDLSLNGISTVRFTKGSFQILECLDLSYNNIAKRELYNLAELPGLRYLRLVGNGFNAIPRKLCMPRSYMATELTTPPAQFRALEVLNLDENNLREPDVFLALAGLKRLKSLSLERNQITSVPYIVVKDGSYVVKSPEGLTGHRKSKKRLRKKKSTEENRSLTNPEIRPTAKSIVDDEGTLPDSIADQLSELGITDLEVDMEKFSVEESDLSDKLGAIPPEANGSIKSCTSLQPAFAELRSLNIAHNKISREIDVIAVASWPSLAEINLHGNPLVINRSGEPPLLKALLSEHLGIHLVRKRPSSCRKPTITMHSALQHERKIHATVPRIPKVDVDTLLAIEASKASKEHRNQDADDRDKNLLLSDGEEDERVNGDGAADVDAKLETEGTGFFMTQGLDEDPVLPNIKTAPFADSNQSPTERQTSSASRSKSKSLNREVSQVDESPLNVFLLSAEERRIVETLDLPSAKDVKANTKALRDSLRFPLTLRQPEKLLVRRGDQLKPLKTTRKPAMPPKPVIQTTEEKLDDLLQQLSKRKAYIEANLADVLKDPKLQKEFPDAAKLFAKVKQRYAKHKKAKDAIDDMMLQ